MELLAGCYEQVLFGFSVRAEPAADGGAGGWAPAADFTHHAHTASLSAVAANSRFVVTGSRDETIHIYDMRKKVDHGALVHHSGTITCLKFHGNRHLVSGAEDGLICVWDVKKWECLKSIRAHRGHVTHLSIHPSGKLALSVGTDKTLRTWNLVEGRSAFIKNIKQNAHIVEWSPTGERYVVVTLNRVDVYQLGTASISGTITSQRRVSSLSFLSESVLAVAGDEEVVRFFDCDSQLCLCEFKAHANRVKDMLAFETPEHRVVVTASSDGFIKMWKLGRDQKAAPALLCEVSTGARLTCLGVWLDGAAGSRQDPPPVAELPQASNEDRPGTGKKAAAEVVREEGGRPEQERQEAGPRGAGAEGDSLLPARKRKAVGLPGATATSRKKKKKKRG